MSSYFCKALLFDLDGTLIDSMEHVTYLWTHWAQRRGLDVQHVLDVMPGLKTIDTIRRVAPQLDAEKEFAELQQEEVEDLRGVRIYPGTLELLRQLQPGQWTIVTSATRPVAEARLKHTGIPIPDEMVTAEMIAHGKPAPDCFLLGARKLGFVPEGCIVLEDAPSGIAAGKAAGMRVIGLATTHAAEELAQANAIIPTIADLEVKQVEGGMEVMVEEV